MRGYSDEVDWCASAGVDPGVSIELDLDVDSGVDLSVSIELSEVDLPYVGDVVTIEYNPVLGSIGALNASFPRSCTLAACPKLTVAPLVTSCLTLMRLTLPHPGTYRTFWSLKLGFPLIMMLIDPHPLMGVVVPFAHSISPVDAW
jgi:hypothetical protein